MHIIYYLIRITTIIKKIKKLIDGINCKYFFFLRYCRVKEYKNSQVYFLMLTYLVYQCKKTTL